MHMKIDKVLHTDGKRLYTDVAKAVRVTGLTVLYDEEEEELSNGELCVYFDETTWNIEENGLIYTDLLFLAELQAMLTELGFAGADVDYSECGMQDEEYVSCDAGLDFMESFVKLKHLFA